MRRFIAPALLAILLATLVARVPGIVAQRSQVLDALDPLVESRAILQDRFVRPVDDPSAVSAAVAGYVASLGDPYTEYVPPRDEAAFERTMRGDYAGIGAEVGMIDGVFTIFTPMPGSPALAAGIRAGDQVLAVDGVSAEGAGSEDVIERLVGEVGTTVDVRVRHEAGDVETLTVTRRRIVSPTVRGLERVGEGWNHCLDAEHGIRYVRLTQFNDVSADEVRTALTARPGEPFRGLVLDLRDNPGGGLPTAISVSDLFLTAGVIVRVVPRVGEPAEYGASADLGIDPSVAVVVLVNEGSASASEIVAGSLQAHGRARVAGTRSFGKGSVQEVMPLSGEGTLKYTVAKYELEGGRRIQRVAGAETWGVDPDPGLLVPISANAWSDVLLDRRDRNGIREMGRAMPTDPFDAADCRTADWVRAELGDEQLARAAEALAVRIETGEWPLPAEDHAASATLAGERADLLDLRAEYARRIDEIDARITELDAPSPSEDPATEDQATP